MGDSRVRHNMYFKSKHNDVDPLITATSTYNSQITRSDTE